MTSTKPFWQSLGKMSITTRFGLGVGLLLSLIVTVAATGWLAMRYVRAAETSIRMSTDIQGMVLTMDRGMEKARRLHGDFFLQYPHIGLSTAHEQYAQPSVRQIAQVITVSDGLRALIARSDVGGALRTRQGDLNFYLSSAKRFADTSIRSVELVTELAAPERGLEAQLEGHFTALREALAGQGNLSHLLFRMRSFTRDYRITRKRHLMQSAFNAAFKLREGISGETAFGDAEKMRFADRLDRCVSTGNRILAVDVEIRSKFNDFALQAEAVGTVSAKLADLAGADVEKARTRINHAHRTALALMAGITLAGLAAAVLIARLLNESITVRVVRLTRSADELRKGNLSVFAEEAGGDELGQLAATFNVMAARIRELVGNLEQKVALRTTELAASERRFRQLFEHSGSGVVVYEPVENGKNFILKDVNRAVTVIEGMERSELIGKKVTEVFPAIAEFGLLDVLRRVCQTGRATRHPVSLYSDGRISGWRENAVYKLPSEEIVAVYEDRTPQMQAEIERGRMETRLQRAKKMEAIGLLAGGVAHDLNNILSGIVGYPELLLMQLPEESELRESVKAIQESGHRAVAVVADLLTLARGVASARVAANLNELAAEYLASPEYRKAAAVHPKVEVVAALDPDLSPMECSPVHITKCIMNLIMNAMEASDGDGRIVVSTHNRVVDEKMAWEHSIRAGNYAVLRVTDDGSGIQEQDLEHIFEPFYTRKVMGKSGTGLGLAVVWNSVMDHEGTIQVKSGDRGTRFTLYFPASGRRVLPQVEGSGTAGLEGSGEKILVVDDEPQQRDLAGRMLEVLGYAVVTAGSGEEAIRYVADQPVDLILLDMIMEPGINGRKTYERIIKIHPNQKAVIVSGFSGSDEVRKAQGLGAGGLLKKPYTLEALARAVQQELTG